MKVIKNKELKWRGRSQEHWKGILRRVSMIRILEDGAYFRVRDFAKKYGVSVKTVRLDVRRLKEAGYPLEPVKDEDGYRCIEEFRRKGSFCHEFSNYRGSDIPGATF